MKTDLRDPKEVWV